MMQVMARPLVRLLFLLSPPSMGGRLHLVAGVRFPRRATRRWSRPSSACMVAAAAAAVAENGVEVPWRRTAKGQTVDGSSRWRRQ